MISLILQRKRAGCVRSEATKAMYEEFGTGRRELFLKNLEGGKYDPGFAHEEAAEDGNVTAGEHLTSAE